MLTDAHLPDMFNVLVQPLSKGRIHGESNAAVAQGRQKMQSSVTHRWLQPLAVQVRPRRSLGADAKGAEEACLQNATLTSEPTRRIPPRGCNLKAKHTSSGRHAPAALNGHANQLRSATPTRGSSLDADLPAYLGLAKQTPKTQPSLLDAPRAQRFVLHLRQWSKGHLVSQSPWPR